MYGMRDQNLVSVRVCVCGAAEIAKDSVEDERYSAGQLLCVSVVNAMCLVFENAFGVSTALFWCCRQKRWMQNV